MSRAGPFRSFHRACFPLAPAQLHTHVHTGCNRNNSVRERVLVCGPPVTVVIVVNLTMVKAVTACPYQASLCGCVTSAGCSSRVLLLSTRKQNLAPDENRRFPPPPPPPSGARVNPLADLAIVRKIGGKGTRKVYLARLVSSINQERRESTVKVNLKNDIGENARPRRME